MATLTTYKLPGIEGTTFDSAVSAILFGKVPVTGSCGTKDFFINTNQWKPKPANSSDGKRYKYYATIRLNGVYYTGTYSTAVFFVDDGTAVKQVEADYKYSDDGKYITVYSNKNIKLYFTFLSSNEYWKEAITVADMLYYEISNDGKSYSVGVKNEYKSIIQNVPDSAIKENIDNVPVTTVDVGGFSACPKLTSVSLPSSIKTINKDAFKSCAKLTGITIPDGVKNIDDYAFYACTNLKTVTFAENSQCSSIGKYVFEACSGLTSITIPDSVKSIGDAAFYGCGSLTTITIPNGVTSIGYQTFKYSGLTTVTIPNSVTSIGGSAFEDCTELKEVHTTSVERWCSIDFGNEYANPLYYAKDLYSPDRYGNEKKVSVLDVGEPIALVDVKKFAFINCSLTEISAFIGSVGKRAFEGCENLTTANLPYCVVSDSPDQEKVFRNCSQLQSITISADSTGIPFAFAAEDNTSTDPHLQEIALWRDSDKEPSGFTYYLLGDAGANPDESLVDVKLTSIGDYAFKRHGAEAVFIPSTVSTVGVSAFSCDISDGEYDSARASRIYIADGVTELQIGTYAFNRFVNASRLYIPVRVTRIGSYAFNDIGFGTYIKSGTVTQIYIYRPYTTVSGGPLSPDNITVADAYPFGNPEAQRADGTYYDHQKAFKLYAPMFDYSVSYCYTGQFNGYSAYTSATNWTAYYYVHGDPSNSRFDPNGFNPADFPNGGATT